MSLKSKVSENDTTSGYLVDKIAGAVEVDDGGNEVLAVAGHWAWITATNDQLGIDESTPDLITAFDTILDGSTGHGVTVSAGIVTLPANTPGFVWRIKVYLATTHSAAGFVQFQVYQAPSGANTIKGQPSVGIAVTHTSIFDGQVPAVAKLSGATTFGVRCVMTTGANTVAFEKEWSRIEIEEVRA
jgi:hypothetical protein